MIKEREMAREFTDSEVDALARTQTVGLTEEDMRKLSAPFPKEVIKSYTGRGGKEMRYIDVDVLEARVAQVDRNWERRVTPGTNGVAVHYVVKGVMRGDMYDNDTESNKYGAPQVNALARACRRSLRLFLVGADLWEDESEGVTEATERDASRPAKENVREFKRPAQKPGSGGASASGPSPKQVELLKNLHVPQSVISKLSAGRDGSASQLITDLLATKRKEDDYDDEPIGYIEGALKKIDRRLVALLDEEDEDED